jgi:LAO/AO transport system kinase
MLTLLEAGDGTARAAVALLAAVHGRAYTVGVTGAPGAGKSSLTNCLIGRIRSTGEAVSVLAVDPSSPRTGGAILGDRVRMDAHATDPGVFVRSMATRGQLGGLAAAVPDAVRLLQASGVPWVLIETVGVGQVELDVAGTADTTVLVLYPGWGDGVQANKAGLLEVADVLVVNKADRPGADAAVRDLVAMLGLAPRTGWAPPVVETVATTGQGVGELWDAVAAHREHLVSTGLLERRRVERRRDEVTRRVKDRLAAMADAFSRSERFDQLVRQADDPHRVAERVVVEVLGWFDERDEDERTDG